MFQGRQRLGFRLGSDLVANRRMLVPSPAECKNAGHLCVAAVDTRTYGTYLGAVSLGRPLINNG
jgi:hypothetical protein